VRRCGAKEKAAARPRHALGKLAGSAELSEDGTVPLSPASSSRGSRQNWLSSPAVTRISETSSAKARRRYSAEAYLLLAKSAVRMPAICSAHCVSASILLYAGPATSAHEGTRRKA
jgi:hypothetical protein